MQKQEEDKYTKKLSVITKRGGNDRNTHGAERMAKNLWRDGVKHLS